MSDGRFIPNIEFQTTRSPDFIFRPPTKLCIDIVETRRGDDLVKGSTEGSTLAELIHKDHWSWR
jgi:hypothetical protein